MTQMYKSLSLGTHHDEFVLAGYRSGEEFMRVSLLVVVLSQVEFEGTSGDDVIHSVVLDYGAIKIESFKQKPDGTTEAGATMEWSRVMNQAEYDASVP
jgi:type VI protein secretion system component Hcp